MNNKGFGLPEVLVFIGISMFILVVTTIYCNTHGLFSNNESVNVLKKEEPVIDNNSNNESIVPNKQLVPNEYKKLEEQLKDKAITYSFDKDESTIITLDKLNINLIDPVDSSIKCNGYVVYKSDDNTFIPYINCPGMYVTENYNFDLE